MRLWTAIVCLQFVTFQLATAKCGILYPKASETREIKSLDGIWNFVKTPMNNSMLGFKKHWYKTDLTKVSEDVHLMPVPSSYNDITQDISIREHVGIVWYDRKFFVPASWYSDTRVWLRFSSVSYAAQVWINGVKIMSHEMGHLPFQTEITSLLDYGENNRISVACDNTLLADTVPQGKVVNTETENGKRLVQTYTFDFFNYAGIHRPVTLYTTPLTYIDDITVNTDVIESTGIIHYEVTIVGSDKASTIVTLLDKEGNTVTSSKGLTKGTLKVPSVNLWWPYLMHKSPGYQYTLRVEIKSSEGNVLDVYRQLVGIRKIAWTNTSMLINDRPIYFHGFGRHEDADIRGKGLDLPTIIRDHNLIKWVGGNAYRTTHYPYSEEIMDLTDELGIMIINECPSVDTDLFSDSLLQKHKDSLTELINRDKNRPSVIMWSIANEPRTQTEASGRYFGSVVQHVKSLDKTRPVTIAIARGVQEDKSGQHLDIISFNRYNAWYSNPGQLDLIVNQVVSEATSWHNKYNKPVLMAEYGADTMAGLHIQPQYIWSEEYQVSLLSKHFKAFDNLRSKGWFIGEFIWNFADFKTTQSYTRVGGNKKGIFTRDRQPKAGAHHLRKRYFYLAKELYNTTLPDDLFEYIASNQPFHDEL